MCFSGTDHILVGQRYGYKLSSSSLENYTNNGDAVKKDILYTKQPTHREKITDSHSINVKEFLRNTSNKVIICK